MKKRLETLLKLGLFAGIVMYFANKFVESSALLRKLLNTDSGRYYNWTHGSVYYTKQGNGNPILLVHDLYPSSSSAEWSEVIDELSQTNTVYAIDLPGCGRSFKPHMTYINYFYAQLLSDFAKDIIQMPTAVIATGISASFATMAAHMTPDYFQSLTFVNPDSPAKLAAVPSKTARFTKAIMDCPILGTFLYYIFCSENEIEYNFTEEYFYNPFLISSRQMHTYYESAHWKQGGGRHLLASLHGNYLTANITHPFAELTQDIHLIFGKELSGAESIASAYSKLHSDIKVTYISKTKKLPQLESPAKFIMTLL
mgnify:FL=1